MVSMGGFVRKQKGMIFIIITVVIFMVQAHTSYCCTQTERAALLQIKADLLSSVPYATQSDAYSELSSWNDDGNASCCSWNRVGCNQPLQQHVTELHLSLYLSDHGNYNATLGWSEGICKLKYLRELELVDNNLIGVLPSCVGHLNSLQILELSFNNLTGDVASIVSNLTSLQKLSLSYNNFKGEFSLNSLVNHSKLQALMLSHSGLRVIVADTPRFPSSFQLNSLGLIDCSLYTQGSTFQQFLVGQHNLSWLDISHNGLSGSFPASIFLNNARLEVAILRNNSLEGILDLRAANATIRSFIYLDISMNRFHGNFPVNIGSVMPMLKYLDASKNAFEGGIPASIGNMTELGTLDLSNNHFSGEVPSSIFTMMSSLQYLILSSNNLHGDVVPEYMNLSIISWLRLDDNHFNAPIHISLLKSKNLEYLDLSNNEMAGRIPSWMGNCSLYSLAMSNNQLQGDIPSELFYIDILDLSNNHLTGRIPSPYSTYSNGPVRNQALILRNNFLSGPIPETLFYGELVTLDLSGNNFSGIFPASFMWGYYTRLVILLLGHNQLHGELPTQLCQLQSINLMDLSGNNFSGPIPSCLANMSFGITSASLHIQTSQYFDVLLVTSCPMYECTVYHNTLQDVEINPEEEIMLLSKGRYYAYNYHSYILGHISGMDLSCNQFTGEIPPELGRLEHIHILNFSHNHLSGSIPSSFSMLTIVESLDLSFNNLSGVIPSQLANVHTLGIFNVSYNNLSGQVPNTGQFANFDENNYMGNPFLYGYSKPRPLLPSIPSKNETEETNDNSTVGFDWQVFFWSFGASSVTMWLACFAVLWINPYWRRAWFQFLDYHVIWWLY